MNEVRKLISFNLAILMVLSLFLVVPAPVLATEGCITIDGVDYPDNQNAQDTQNGKWEYAATQKTLTLTDYVGGPISTDSGVTLVANGTCIITGTDSPGLTVGGVLHLKVMEGGSLRVIGGADCSAVIATQININMPGNFTAVGSGKAALAGTVNTVKVQGDVTMTVGADEANTEPGTVYDKEFYMHMECDEYTISYDANGGNFMGDAPPDRKVAFGDSITMSFPEVQREGYIFMGWQATVASVTSYYPEGWTFTQEYYPNTSDAYTYTTMKAQWQAVPSTAYVIFDGNGRRLQNHQARIVNSTFLEGSLTIPIYYGINGGPTGERLRGWSTDPDYDYDPNAVTGPFYRAGDSHEFESGTILYAVYDSRNYITYVGNGGVATDGAIQVILDSETRPAVSDLFTRTGHRSLEWNTQEDGEGNTYKAGETVYEGSPTVLYAMWMKAPEKAVYYHGYSYTGPPPTVNETYYFKEPDSENKLVLDDQYDFKTFYFDGWNTEEDGSGQWYVAGSEITVTGRIDLYAQMLDSRDKHVLLYISDGYFNNRNFKELNPDGKFPFQTTLPAHMKGYELQGWMSWSPVHAYGLASLPGETVILNQTRIFYAACKENPYNFHTCLLHFGNGGQTEDGENARFITSSRGDLKLFNASSAKFVREGYTLAGWSTDPDPNQGHIFTCDQESTDIRALSADYADDYAFALYAVWENNDTCLVTPTEVDDPDVFRCQRGEAMTLPEPFREGKAFAGWRTPDGRIYAAGESLTITENINITALWKDPVASVLIPNTMIQSRGTVWLALYRGDRFHSIITHKDGDRFNLAALPAGVTRYKLFCTDFDWEPLTPAEADFFP